MAGKGLFAALAALCLPIAPYLAQPVVSKASKEHIIRRLVLWMLLEPVALEPLG